MHTGGVRRIVRRFASTAAHLSGRKHRGRGACLESLFDKWLDSNLDSKLRLGRFWSPLGSVLGALGCVLGALGAVLVALGDSWGALGGILGALGRVLGALGAVLEARDVPKSSPRDISHSKHVFIERSITFRDFLGPGAYSEGILALLEASWAS